MELHRLTPANIGEGAAQPPAPESPRHEVEAYRGTGTCVPGSRTSLVPALIALNT